MAVTKDKPKLHFYAINILEDDFSALQKHASEEATNVRAILCRLIKNYLLKKKRDASKKRGKKKFKET